MKLNFSGRFTFVQKIIKGIASKYPLYYTRFFSAEVLSSPFRCHIVACFSRSTSRTTDVKMETTPRRFQQTPPFSLQNKAEHSSWQSVNAQRSRFYSVRKSFLSLIDSFLMNYAVLLSSCVILCILTDYWYYSQERAEWTMFTSEPETLGLHFHVPTAQKWYCWCISQHIILWNFVCIDYIGAFLVFFPPVFPHKKHCCQIFHEIVYGQAELSML